jgi:hypothetical protein
MAGFDIRDLRKNQAEKFAKAKEEEDNEKKKQEETKKIETEQKLLQEIMVKNEFDDMIAHLDTILVDVNECMNILEMDMYVEVFKRILEQNSKFLETEYCREELVQKITELINCVSQNTNSKFDITAKDLYTDSAQKITDNIKLIMNLCKLNETDINIELMDTTNDEDIAKKLQQDDNNYNMEFHEFVSINHRMDDDPDLMDNIPELVDDNKFGSVPSLNQQIQSIVIPTIKTQSNPEYYIGFDAIEDPELVQLAYFQNDLLDD